MTNAEKNELVVNAQEQWVAAQLVMREINKIQFLEHFQKIAPDIVRELQRHGVIFPK